jgi:hypothetical protein
VPRMVLCWRHRSARKPSIWWSAITVSREVLSHTFALYLHAALDNPPLRLAQLLD